MVTAEFTTDSGKRKEAEPLKPDVNKTHEQMWDTHTYAAAGATLPTGSGTFC